VDSLANQISVTNPRSFGQWAIGLPSAFSPAQAGLIPTDVRLEKDPGGIRVSWSPSCSNDALDYSIHEGQIGDWYSHSAVDCSDEGGDLVETVAPEEGDRYFLVVPMSADVEGTYGFLPDGTERPRGESTCRAVQIVDSCEAEGTCDDPLGPLPVPSVTGATTVGAPFDEAPFCEAEVDAPGRWFTVIGTGTTVTASTCPLLGGDADYDTRINVYSGSCDTLGCVAGNDDDFDCKGGGYSTVSWCSVAGEEYRILVHGSGLETGNFALSIFDDGLLCERAPGH